MKKTISILLVFVMLLSSTITYGSIADKLSNHWADSLISRSFVAYYFPYLAKDSFARFEPGGTITGQDFNISLASLFKDYGYTVSGIGASGNLLRTNMVNILGARLMEIGLNNDENVEIPFKDVNTMPSDSIELLRLLYNNKIVVGDPNSNFSPSKDLTQVESIIILQRVKEVLENMNIIAFNTLGIVQSYNNQEELIIQEENNKILLTITKQFPTPGYSMAVNKIRKEGDNYRVYFDITTPKPDSIQLQVITYKTLTMEIEKDLLNGSPYNFILDGFNSVKTN